MIITRKIHVIAFILFLITSYSYTDTDNWKYNIKITNSGTRSQGKRGILLYKNISIGYYFHSILTPIGKYSFTWSRLPWKDKGYNKISNQTSHDFINSLVRSNNTMKRIINRGYYKGFAKYKKTPENWIRVMRDGQYFWINPEELVQFIKRHRFSSLITRFLRIY